MESLWIYNGAEQKARMRWDNVQLTVLVTLSAILCLATVVLIGSDLLFGDHRLRDMLCHDRGPAWVNTHAGSNR